MGGDQDNNEQSEEGRSAPAEPDLLKWWQRAVFYEIAPISFQDSNGDGKGDLPGLIRRIDYLEWLGIGAVWLTPTYRSPMLDLGYDVSDFCTVDRLFGSLEDFDRLIKLLHQRQIRLIIDFVPNHTSDQHPWFHESRSSRTNLKREWYVWADGASDGGPPNNWLSRFGGSAWQWDDSTGQYYYHSFLVQQPGTRRCATRWPMCFAFGCGGASMGFVSMPVPCSSKTTSYATIRPTPQRQPKPLRLSDSSAFLPTIGESP